MIHEVPKYVKKETTYNMMNYKHGSSCLHSILSSGREKGFMKLLNNIFKKSHIIVKPIDSLLGSQSEEFMKIYLPYSQ